MNKNKTAKVSGRNKNAQVATRVGNPIDLRAWMAETTTKDGKEVRKNLSEEAYASLSKGKETKDKDGRITEIRSDEFTLTLEVAKRKVPATKDGKLYEAEYASLLPLTGEAATTLVDGNLDTKVDKDGNELPSVVKYFRQGYGMLARNSAGAAIATLIEGPDKAREQAIKNLMKAKGWDYDKAKAKVELLMAED